MVKVFDTSYYYEQLDSDESLEDDLGYLLPITYDKGRGYYNYWEWYLPLDNYTQTYVLERYI